MLFKSVILALAAATSVFAQNCGPAYGNQICAAGTCCSQYGWCDTDAAHCDPKTCNSKFSGVGSSCYKLTHTTTTLKTSTKATTTTKPTSTSTFNGPYKSKVPDIDVCGNETGGAHNVTCPGAGSNGYFYRCCSSAGHCGPKNNIQDEDLYCGSGCQGGFGACTHNIPVPSNPTGTPGVAQSGETCGPIVNKKCATGLCCSGSNFCGATSDFCGAANWCQKSWGQCS